MPKFRKKPIVIEAEQFLPYEDGDAGKILIEAVCYKAHYGFLGEAHIHTLEGTYRARDKDWIIKGVIGEFYPCKPDIFEKTYEAVKE